MTPEEFTARYMPQFSEQQKAAVRETEGPVLLLAVPGSGKTTVLVTRLGYMALCRGIDPARILAVTYTVAATRELRARFTARFPELAGQTPEFRTINGLSSKIIEACGRQRGPAFALQENAGELSALVGRIYQALNGEYPTDSTIREVRTAITYCKNMMLSVDEIAAQDFGLPRFSELYARYCAALREARQMDYDDQMAYALAILRKRPEVLAEFQERYPYLCVDESQDTSRVQHAIIELLAKKTGNLFMVGDEDQSIYGFRAAYPEALLRFSVVWPGAKTLLLEDNYRSTPEILRLAGAFIEGNRDRYPKTIRARRESGCRVRLAHAASRQTQYRYLLALAAKSDAPFAVLYRNNDSALPLIDALERAELPYRCRSFDDTFFTHRIVCDVQDILHFSAAPGDTERFLRIYYKFGALISKEAAQAACAQSERTRAPILDCLLAQAGSSDESRERVRRLKSDLEMLQALPGEALMRTIWGTLGYGGFVAERRLDPGKYFILHMLAAREPSAEGFLARLDTLRQTIRAHADAPSAFIREARGYLPVPVRAKNDFAAILPENACGLRYRHETRGEGEILAQCEDEMLVAFPDGDCLMQAGQMLLERSREAVFQTPGLPAAAQTPDAQAFGPGSVIQHKKYGMGRIVSIDGPFADIRFEGETSPRRFDLAKSLHSGFLFAVH